MARTVDDASREYKKLEKILENIGQAQGKQIKTTKTLNASMIKMGVTLKEQRKSWKDLGLKTNLVTKAFKGHTASVAKVTNAYKKFQNSQKKVGKGMFDITNKGRLLQNSFATIRGKMLLASFAASLLARTFGAAFKAAAEQQQAEIKLSTALGRTSKELLNHASAMQQVTRFGDEVVIGAQASIAAFIQDEEVIKSLTEATVDLAAAKGMDLTAAADMVAKSVGSSTNALSRYGIAAVGAAKSTERAESVVKNISTLYGGQAKAQAESYAGTLDGMKNAVGDAAEAIGELLAPIIIVLADALKVTANMIERFVDGLTSVSSSVQNFFFGMTQLQEATFDYSKTLVDFQKNLSDLSFQELSDEAESLNEWLNPVKEETKKVSKEFDILRQTTTAVAEATGVAIEKDGKIIGTTLATANAIATRVDMQNRLDLMNKQIAKSEAFAQELYSKTATSQIEATQKMIDWVKANEDAFKAEGSHIAALQMLEAQMGSLQKKEDELLQKRIQGINLTISAFSSMASAQKTEIESRMNAELTALRDTDRFKRMSSERQAEEEKKITDKFKAERKRNWENEKAAKIAQATLNAYQSISKALTASSEILSGS